MPNFFPLYVPVFASFFILASAQFNNGPRGDFRGDGFGSGPIGGGIGGSDQELTYEAKGRLICGLTAMGKVRVVLWDRNRGRDNIIYDEVETDVIGSFRVRAKGSSYNSQVMAPFLTIYHDCDDEATPGLRKMTVQLPSQYTNRGQLVLKSFDIGTWNLETSFAGEELETMGGGRGSGGFGQGNRGQFGGDRNSWNHGGRGDFNNGGISV